jgi:hypothetical protein
MTTKKLYIAKVGLGTGSEGYVEEGLRETFEEAEKDLAAHVINEELDFVDNFTFEIGGSGELMCVIDCDGSDPKSLLVDYDEYFKTRAYLDAQ